MILRHLRITRHGDICPNARLVSQEGKTFSSPEEAMAWIDSHRGKPIPVYDKEGETKVGEFISGR